jgi:CHAT domain-containing protein
VKYPDLAAEFEVLRDELDAPATHGDLGVSEIQPSIALTRREQVAQKFDEKVEAIRQDVEFRDFLKSPTVAKLKSAALVGPVIIINVSRHRTDALIISANQEVDKLPLQNLPLSKIQDWVLLLQSRKITEPQMFELLEWLWDSLASPILERLESLPKAQSQKVDKPHVWWIPTGPLCSLPIHAAGRYTQGSMPFTSLLDKVVSSYSPSVKAMLFTQRNKGQLPGIGSAQSGNMPLLVAMGDTPGLKSLPYARKEVRVVRDKLASLIKNGEDPILPEPKKSEVLAKLLTAPILHFAGHGKSDQIDPLQSALLVRDWKEDLLTVKDLMDLKLHQNPPFLAYLSACSTGSNKVDDLLDEGLHLMSACQLVGFQHVIGSLWEVSDQHCIAVARTVFAKLVDSDMSDSSVSLGLQEGVRYLRDRGRPGFRTTRNGSEDDGDDSDISDNEELADTGRAGHGEALDINDRPWLGGDPRIWAAYIHIGR